MKKYILLSLVMLLSYGSNYAQKASASATSFSNAEYMIEIPALSTMTNIEPASQHKAGPVRRSGQNKVIQGKGYPKNGDPLKQMQENVTQFNGKAPDVSFTAHNGFGLNDPTGAIGPNHYVYAFNSGFGIKSRTGATLMAEASLSTLFPGETLGDPVVVYDKFADRFIVMEFSNTPNGYLVAVCQGPDPVNDGWFTYRFNTGTFPDYQKLSVWSDGYYVTANKDQNSAATSEVVWALERDEMLLGNPSAQIVGFGLTGIVTSGFYSPAGFNANGDNLPPPGNAPIVYMQDDAWSGVSDDHVKLWNINVNWNTPASSTISSPQIITTADFDGLFDGGSFVNLPQPSGGDIDALQATIMYMAQYRRFPTHNSAVFNFVVDLDGNDDYAGIRWYELRQANDGDPWTIYQEGTYTRPAGLSAFCGGIAQDKYGNIGLAYTVVSSTQAPSIRFTGRMSSDPLNTMTLAEDVIINSTFSDPTTRYGDYAQMTIDPVDDQTFWHIAEYFGSGSARNSRVGAFKLAPEFLIDAGVVSVDSPVSSTLGANESVTISIRNFGLNPISNIPVSYQIDGGTVVNGTFAGTIASDAVVQYTFPTTADLSSVGTTYNISATTNLSGDEFADNDGIDVDVTNLAPIELGVIAVTNPYTTSNLTSAEDVTITVQNFGGTTQSNIPVSYTINGGTAVTGSVPGPLSPGATVDFTFSTQGNFAAIGDYIVTASTNKPGDAVPGNNSITVLITNSLCQPAMFNLLTDCYEDETSWRLEDDMGGLIQEVTSSELGDQTLHNYDFCLSPGCYTLIIEDTFGDGLNGAAFACGVDGDYSFDLNGTTIITMGNPDFDFIIEHDFCVEGGGDGTQVNLKALLQGAFNSSSQLMNDQLRANNDLPLNEPYEALGFEIVGAGGETTTNDVLSVTGDNAIVDWILVELRDGNDATSNIATKAGLIQRDGDIVSTNGVSPLTFDLPSVNSVYVVIRHRNHFGVRTNGTYLTSDLIDIDFTNPTLDVFGTDAMINVDGLNMLIGGDANGDAVVNSIDKNAHWRLENGQTFDYSNIKADFNLDGIINAVDKNTIWRINNGSAGSLD